MSNLVFKKEFKGYTFQIFDSKPSFEVAEVKQVHGKIVIDAVTAELKNIEADGIFSTDHQTPLAIKTADCLPIVVIGKNGHALLHAGWRGVHQKIVKDPKLVKLDPYFFYIGPHIQLADFLVKEDFKKNFPKSPHFLHNGEKISFNLAAEVQDQIKLIYSDAEVQISPLSTVTESCFHSFRADATTQRNWNVLFRGDSTTKN